METFLALNCEDAEAQCSEPARTSNSWKVRLAEGCLCGVSEAPHPVMELGRTSRRRRKKGEAQEGRREKGEAQEGRGLRLSYWKPFNPSTLMTFSTWSIVSSLITDFSARLSSERRRNGVIR